jgi:hypothetical protein
MVLLTIMGCHMPLVPELKTGIKLLSLDISTSTLTPVKLASVNKDLLNSVQQLI